MNLSDAIRLLPGDRLTAYGDHHFTAKWNRWKAGTVVVVSEDGGILVDCDEGQREWTAYNHVREFRHTGEELFRTEQLTDEHVAMLQENDMLITSQWFGPGIVRSTWRDHLLLVTLQCKPFGKSATWFRTPQIKRCRVVRPTET